MTRREFMSLGVASGAVGASGVLLPLSIMTSKTSEAAPVTEAAADGAATQPARPVTIEEVSRHPSEMPDSSDYTRYEAGRWFDPVSRTGSKTIDVVFSIQEGVTSVVPGTTLDVWTFDGTVPGPMIRGRVGDNVDFTLVNPNDSTMPHNVDFHAVTGPGGGAVSLNAAPGASSRIKVQLISPGIYIYHCAFPDIPTHISHGMYGLIVVEPEEGLPNVDHEYYLMQSEFYTIAGGRMSVGDLGDYGHLDFALDFGNLGQPTFVVFNGRPNAITGDRALGTFGSSPIRTGETARFYVGNIGPNLISSFHVIGEIFKTVYVEGSFDLVNHNVQTTLVPSGGAVGVELRFEVPGDYVIVDHSIFRVHKGALGLINVQGEVRPDIYKPIGG